MRRLVLSSHEFNPLYTTDRTNDQTTKMNEIRQLKIGFYCQNDPKNKGSWSGIPFYLGKTIEEHIGTVDYLGPVVYPRLLEKATRGVMRFFHRFFKSRYFPQYNLLQNKYASMYLKKRMRGKQYDFLIAPAAAPELAFLHTDIPIVYFGDATFKAYSSTYTTVFANVSSMTKWEGNLMEKMALSKSSLILMSSRWAANSAAKDYGVPYDKIEVISMGANIDEAPARDVIFEKEKNETLTLLFLAVDWERKGGNIALDTLVSLKKLGINANLIICGCVPPVELKDEAIKVIPFIDKNIKEDCTRLIELLSSVHFMLLPTRADCTPLVNCESGAYGIPVITTIVGGVSETVQDGVNGHCLPPNAGGQSYADLIKSIYADKDRYHSLIQSSRDRFDTELNWAHWAYRFKKVLTERNLV